MSESLGGSEDRLSNIFSLLLGNALGGNTNRIGEERPSSSNSQETAKDSRYNEKSASIVTQMECMLIAARGEDHDPEIKAIPKEEMDTNEVITRIEGLNLPNEAEGGATMTDYHVVRRLLLEDKLKELKYEFEETNGNQRPRQFYIDKIVELFQKCKEPGGKINIIYKCVWRKVVTIQWTGLTYFWFLHMLWLVLLILTGKTLQPTTISHPSIC